jgi:hypothetical protein
VTARPVAAKNPTSVVLPVPIERVDACWDRFHRSHTRAYIRTEEDAKSVQGGEPGLLVLRGEAVVRDPHDVLLTAAFPFGRSEVYLDDQGKGLPYQADFLVHAIPVDSARTRIDVETIRSKVITGRELTVGHAWEKYVFRDVPPTTIDEYRVIRCLADCLGVKEGLPPVTTPPPAKKEADAEGVCRAAATERDGGDAK